MFQKNVIKTTLNIRNITAVNTYVISVITYYIGVLKWSNMHLEMPDRRIRLDRGRLNKYRSRYPGSAELVYMADKRWSNHYLQILPRNKNYHRYTGSSGPTKKYIQYIIRDLSMQMTSEECVKDSEKQSSILLESTVIPFEYKNLTIKLER
ncbi:hypothetical protein HHI36_001115 [Cryptolaemus montrouzieri]|uniref:Uncharacterized protein n=1 Tax=Cryptolaemus montrouzieri TaxID=559131 RepID=A0ABD2P7I4_9CUCU